MVCAQYGEPWLDTAVMELIEQVIRQQPEPKRFHQVPVYSLADLTSGSL